MPKILVIRGYCGTGKSSVAKKIAKKNNYALLEYDNFLWNMNPVSKPSKFEYEISFLNFLSVLKNYLKTKKNIVIEGPLVQRTKEDPFEIKKVISIIKRAKYNYKIVQLVANEIECIKRMKKRNQIVSKREREMFKSKHNNSIQKNEIVIDNSKLSITQTINKIQKRIKTF
jgi:dephospho-CoA kinase